MSEAIIELDQISKQYIIGAKKPDDLRNTFSSWFRFSKQNKQIIWALKDLTFSVKEGEILGIIGPNGSGKSTLLKILSKITQPTSGKAIVRGKVSSLLEVGTGFHPELTGRENVFLNGSILGLSRKTIKSRFDEIVDFSGVDHYIDTPVKHFSSGMYMRLAFSVAAYLNPEILIVDEVLSVGDLEFQKKSLGKLRQVASSGKTILLVSHNLGNLKNLCTSGLLLNKGEIEYHGNINDTIKKYLIKSSSEFKKPHAETTDGIEMKSFEIINSSNIEGSNYESGESCTFKLCFTSNRAISFIYARYEITDEYGSIIFNCNNYLTGNELSIKRGENNYFCYIPKIPLNTGNYNINLFVWKDNLNYISATKLSKLIIWPGHFYETGKMPKRDKIILLDHNWKCE